MKVISTLCHPAKIRAEGVFSRTQCAKSRSSLQKERLLRNQAKEKEKIKAAEADHRTEAILTKIPVTKKTTKFASHGTKLTFRVDPFLHTNEKGVCLIAAGSTPSRPFSTPMELTASQTTGSRQPLSTAISSHERDAVHTHA